MAAYCKQVTRHTSSGRTLTKDLEAASSSPGQGRGTQEQYPVKGWQLRDDTEAFTLITIFHLTPKAKTIRVKVSLLINELKNPATLEQPCKKPSLFHTHIDVKQWFCTISWPKAAPQWKRQLFPFLSPSTTLERLVFRCAQMLSQLFRLTSGVALTSTNTRSASTSAMPELMRPNVKALMPAGQSMLERVITKYPQAQALNEVWWAWPRCQCGYTPASGLPDNRRIVLFMSFKTFGC